MKANWLNKQNNKKLLVFMAGWSFDYNPFKMTACGDYDVLFVYDYNNINPPKEFDSFAQYEQKNLIAWSMGVFAAYLHKDLFDGFDNKIAVNGTTTPVDDNFGIPVKIFELTLKHARKGLEGKFYQNVFQTLAEYEKYCQNPVQRSIDNRVSELENLYSLIKNRDGANNERFYDIAIVCDYDKIIPPLNQKESHKRCSTPIISLPYGHNPFYNFAEWDDIIKCKQITKQ